jgi:hypothetical protein
MCSDEAVPVKCGISRIWVLPEFRYFIDFVLTYTLASHCQSSVASPAIWVLSEFRYFSDFVLTYTLVSHCQSSAVSPAFGSYQNSGILLILCSPILWRVTASQVWHLAHLGPIRIQVF